MELYNTLSMATIPQAKTGDNGHIHFEAMASLPSDLRGAEREFLF